MSIFRHMLRGTGLLGIKPNADDATCLNGMIDQELGRSVTFVPEYIRTLFHHFLTKQTFVVCDSGLAQFHDIGYQEIYDMNAYGHKKIMHLFIKNGNVDFMLFMQLFPNIQTFTLGDFATGGAKYAATLSLEFIVSILECIDYLEESLSRISFPKFEFVKPSASIEQFIRENQFRFLNKGWELKRDVFVHEGMFARFKGQETLLIGKIRN